MIVKDINEAIERGFIERERFSDIARRVKRAFDTSYYRSTVIARTEAHRVREKATHNKAEEFEQQGIVMEKVWNNVDDERVRQTGRRIIRRCKVSVERSPKNLTWEMVSQQLRLDNQARQTMTYIAAA
ncbi:phage minor head protein [Bacillus sp. SL00103]